MIMFIQPMFLSLSLSSPLYFTALAFLEDGKVTVTVSK